MNRWLLLAGILVATLLASALLGGRSLEGFSNKYVEDWVGSFMPSLSPAGGGALPDPIVVTLSQEGVGTVDSGGARWGFSLSDLNNAKTLSASNVCSIITLTQTGQKDTLSGLNVLSAEVLFNGNPMPLADFMAQGGCLMPSQPMPTWAVNQAGKLFKSTADYAKWVPIDTPVPVGLVKLNKNFVVALDTKGNIYYSPRPADGTKWQQLCGTLTYADLDDNNVLYGINAQEGGAIIYYKTLSAPLQRGAENVSASGAGQCSDWQQIAGPGAIASLAVNSKGIYVCLSGSEEIQYYLHSNSTWTAMPGTRASSISASETGLWVVGDNNTIYSTTLGSDGTPSTNFSQIGSQTFETVSAKGAKFIWGTNAQGNIFNCTAPCSDGAWQPVHGLATEIASLR